MGRTRRHILAATAAGVAGLAGCSDVEFDDSVPVEIYNHDAGATHRLTVTVTVGDEQVFDRTLRIEGRGSQTFGEGLTDALRESGSDALELTVVVNGDERMTAALDMDRWFRPAAVEAGLRTDDGPRLAVLFVGPFEFGSSADYPVTSPVGPVVAPSNASRLTPTSPQSGALFGSVLALSETSAVVGSRTGDVAPTVFTATDSGWRRATTLGEPQPASALAVGDGTVVVGRGDRVTVFERGDRRWTARDRIQGMGKPAALAVENGTVLAGNPATTTVAVLERDSDGWSRTPPITRGTPGPFGTAVDVDENRAVIGAAEPMSTDPADSTTGAAYVFERVDGTWQQQTRIEPSEDRPGFGWAVALDGDTAVVGAPGIEGGEGGAFAYELDGDDWQRQGRLEPDRAGTDRLGLSVALAGERAILGGVGAVSVHARWSGGWATRVRLDHTALGSRGEFGSPVAMNGARVLVGVPDTGETPGVEFLAPSGSREQDAADETPTAPTTGTAPANATATSRQSSENTTAVTTTDTETATTDREQTSVETTTRDDTEDGETGVAYLLSVGDSDS